MRIASGSAGAPADQISRTRVCCRVMVRMVMRTYLFASALFSLFFLFFSLVFSSTEVFGGGAMAQQAAPLIPLPELAPCQESPHPSLPQKWRGIFLMAPFTNAQMVLSDIAYDASIPAMRVKLYGLQGGSLDLFVDRSDTYVLSSDGQAVNACENLGDTGWRVFPRDWLSPRSQCVGTAPLGNTDVQWWKTPIKPAPSSYWIWFKSADQTPFRLAFQSPGNELNVLSRYALSYQLGFDSNPDFQLSEINRVCQGAKRVGGNGAKVLEERLSAALSSTRERASQQIQQLAPQVAACPAAALPRWPDKLAITGLMTPWDANENPYRTEVFYDWTVRAQRTRVFPHAHARFVMQDALLLGPRGYNVTYRKKEAPICTPVLPGALRPDWAARGPCKCEAMLTGTSALTPYGTTRIFSCPLASPRAAWAWYSLDGRPTSFAVSSLPGDQGFGLFAVLDYRDWLPGHEAPSDPPTSVFEEPAQCRAHDAAIQADTGKCSTCHLGKPAQ